VHRPAKHVNWSTLFAWHAITDAQKKVSWSPTTIIRELRQVNNGFFQYLTKQTLREWIEDLGGFKCWKLSAVARTLKGNIPDHNKGGRSAILV
jgi:hypothetical protein